MDIEEKRKQLRELLAEDPNTADQEEALRTPLQGDETDLILATAEKEIAVGILNLRHERRIQIRAALKKIDNDSYGVCESCGDQINPKRLDASPWAPFCRTCQEEADRSASPFGYGSFNFA